MKKFPYTWKQIFTTPKLLKFYGWQVLKVWCIFFVMGLMLGGSSDFGSLDWIGLLWQLGLFSIGVVLLAICTAKYCPTYITFHKEN